MLHSWLFTSHKRNSPGDFGGLTIVHSAPSPVRPLEFEKVDMLMDNQVLEGAARMRSTKICRAQDGVRKPRQLILHNLKLWHSSVPPGTW